MPDTPISRRDFVKAAAAATAALSAPLVLTSCAKTDLGPTTRPTISPASKLGVAFVGTGGQARGHVNFFASRPDYVCVAYADVDKTHWPKDDSGNPLFPGATPYTDYRKMFDKHAGQIDLVVVATPDHTHAPAAMMALRHGKPVYCEKPLTWSVDEARALARETAKRKIPTQMGNQGHANEGNRLIVEWVRSGAIGAVREVHTWTDRPGNWWPQGAARINKGQKTAPPPDLDWDCWIGSAPYRDYSEVVSKDAAGADHRYCPYEPFRWRAWFDFGCGAIGDMGCHTFDNVFWSMEPDYPSSIELIEATGLDRESFPTSTHVKWEFPAKGPRPAFTAHWYDGGRLPPIPEEFSSDPDMQTPGQNRTLPDNGNLYVGDKGMILVSGAYGDSPRLIPEKAMRDFKRPEKTIPRSPGHHTEWLLAVRGEKPWNFPASNFATYAGPLTEVMLLGAICQRLGQPGLKIECDPVKREVKTAEARALLGREYRKGWSL